MKVAGPGAGIVTFADDDIGAHTTDWYCTQDHRLTMAFKGLEWIESELLKQTIKRFPIPKP